MPYLLLGLKLCALFVVGSWLLVCNHCYIQAASRLSHKPQLDGSGNRQGMTTPCHTPDQLYDRTKDILSVFFTLGFIKGHTPTFKRLIGQAQ